MVSRSRWLAAMLAAPLLLASASVSGDALAAEGGAAGTGSIAASPPRLPAIARLGGATRYETAAAVALEASRQRPGRVRIVRGDRPLDAVATSVDVWMNPMVGFDATSPDLMAPDAAPVLFVPPTGPMPPQVRAVFAKIHPSQVSVVGSERVLPSARVKALAGASRVVRIAQDNPVQLSSSRGFVTASRYWDDAPQISVGSLAVVSAASGAIAGAAAQAIGIPVVLLGRGAAPKRPAVPVPVSGMSQMTAIGGPSSTPDAALLRLFKAFSGSVVPSPPYVRVTGPDRYSTQATLARRGFPHGAKTVYLVNGSADADAAAATSLIEGPVLLVPACSGLPVSVGAEIARLHPNRVVAIGTRDAVCDRTLLAARTAATRSR